MEQKRTVVVLVDDIDGTEEATTVRFGLDGKTYRIELSEKNEAKLRKALAPFVEHARPDRQQRRRKSGKGPKSADVRAWAAEQGIEVNPTGRVPQDLVEQYVAAH